VLVTAMIGSMFVLGPVRAAGAAPADECATSGAKTISGTAQGEDGRYIWAFIGIEFFDAAGNKLGGLSPAAYNCHIRINNSQLGGEGSTTSDGGKWTKNWSVAAPAATDTVWLEMYVRPYETGQVRYGFAKREKVKVGAGGRVINLRAPLICGIRGDNAVTGSTGEITGMVRKQFMPVPPTPGAWMAAWNQGPDSDNYMMGWNFGTWNDDGSYSIPNLAPNQIYSVWIFEPGKDPLVTWSVPVNPCQQTHRDLWPTGSPEASPYWLPPYQMVSGDFDDDGHDDLLQYGLGSLGDRVASGAPRNEALPRDDVAINGHYVLRSGDFDGDGHDDLLFYAPGTAPDYFWWGTPTRGSFTSQPVSINGVYDPIIGDFDGDDRADIIWYAPGTAADYLWLGRGGRGGHSDERLRINGRYRPLVGDFGPDGRDDVLWYAAGTKPDYLWTSAGAPGSFTSARFTVNGTYEPVIGDFDGDLDADILWYATGTRADYSWEFENGSYVSRGVTINGDYLTVAADTDGDGRDDVGFRNHDQSRNDYIWFGRSDLGFDSAPRDL